MSKEEYMFKRAEHIALLRGIGTGLPFNPSLRMQAIQQLEPDVAKLDFSQRFRRERFATSARQRFCD